MKDNQIYIKRCFDLAKRGWGNVSPNPMVGCILVYEDMIIGEGWHQYYGGPHAEVNAINSVSSSNKNLIKDSTLFISLEPCNFYGKTPPCTELIIDNQIKKVVISNLDHTTQISGKSIKYLRTKGISVITNILHSEGADISKYRNTIVDYKRPFIQIKYAVSSDGYMGENYKQISISNKLSKRFVHQLRAKSDAILIGKNTALIDNPYLTTRNWPGNNPIRILIDPDLIVPLNNHLFNSSSKVYIFNSVETKVSNNIYWEKLDMNKEFLNNMLNKLYQDGIGILIVEGGSKTIQHFIDKQLYDEIYEINSIVVLNNGVIKPKINCAFKKVINLKDDFINFYSRIDTL